MDAQFTFDAPGKDGIVAGGILHQGGMTGRRSGSKASSIATSRTCRTRSPSRMETSGWPIRVAPPRARL
jgi:hypothetical protein